MLRALQLARQGRFGCSPNPMVGCVIVRDQQVLSEGWHQRAGEAHAEIIALNACDDATDAILYVTLEPCCHHGRTAPCVEAIIQAKITKVVIGCQDPNPNVAGQGVLALQQAGILVEYSEHQEECIELNRYFFHAMQKEKPYVIAKWAMSLDGKIASKTGASQWISNALSRENVHQVRHQVDAILVGAGTIFSDDPQLTVRKSAEAINPDEQPLRIILDGKRSLPNKAKIFNHDLPGKTVLASELMKKKSYQLSDLLAELNRLEIRSLFIEGGSQVLTDFLQRDLVDEIQCYVAPKLIGGQQALTPFSGEGCEIVPNKVLFNLHSCEKFSDDVLLIYRRGER